MNNITLNQLLKYISISLAIILVALFISNKHMSRSGANKILRTNGNMTVTKIYKNDTLFYKDNDSILSKQELKALTTQIEHYTVILE